MREKSTFKKKQQRVAVGGKAAWIFERNGLLRARRTMSMQAGADTPLPTRAYVCMSLRGYFYCTKPGGTAGANFCSCPCKEICWDRSFFIAENHFSQLTKTSPK